MYQSIYNKNVSEKDINTAEKEAEQKNTQAVSTDNAPKMVHNVTASSKFSDTVDEAKVNTVKEASVNDTKFVEDFKKELKDATLKLAQVEKQKAELEIQNLKYESELLRTQQELNEQQQTSNSWESKQKKREFHYNGVKPIMEFVGISSPMNLVLLYLLTIFLTPFFLAAKFWVGTIGAAISGASDEDRAKTAKGFLWTLLCFVALSAVGIVVLISLKVANVI